MARCRFDRDVDVAAAEGADNSEGDLSCQGSPSKNPHTRQFVDPDADKRNAISKIRLAAATMYMIDKVVRAKSLAGPIGVDNSEVINLEMEREFRQRNRYLDNLAAAKKGAGESDEESDLNDDEQGLTPEERENLINEKLLQRLYKAAERDLEKANPQKVDEDDNRSAMTAENKEVLNEKNDGKPTRAVPHDVWLRVKEHQEKLKRCLIQEAKEDLYEKLLRR